MHIPQILLSSTVQSQRSQSAGQQRLADVCATHLTASGDSTTTRTVPPCHTCSEWRDRCSSLLTASRIRQPPDGGFATDYGQNAVHGQAAACPHLEHGAILSGPLLHGLREAKADDGQQVADQPCRRWSCAIRSDTSDIHVQLHAQVISDSAMHNGCGAPSHACMPERRRRCQSARVTWNVSVVPAFDGMPAVNNL